MPLLTSSHRVSFGCAIEGTHGRFSTPAGEVIFIQTRGRLARAEATNAARLTSRLTPAREALEVKEMDFNQLLQRDLDDHRIAHELVPYILSPQLNGPAFFPPILAALLPFENRRPVPEMPKLEENDGYTDPDYQGARWTTWTSGDVFRLQVAQDDPVGTAILRWNDERAKLVIMDGQHRAMALLAVHRTLTNSWASAASSSERYRPFYEAQVRRLWKLAEEKGYSKQLENLEFPVTLCIFPDETGPDRHPHSAARKLFVDVNQEAKKPSESRLILLSDIRLDHVLARELLNYLRAGDSSLNLPLYAVEYDNPETRATTPRRWSAVTNLEILVRAVDFSCFGPAYILDNVATLAAIRGKPNRREKGAFFRAEMKLQDVLEASFTDGPRTMERQEIGIDFFPIYNKQVRQALLGRFMELWGSGILRLLSEVLPYRAHIEAVKAMNDSWGPAANVTSDLAREALFEGVGMFWTLEQGHEHWQEEVRKARRTKVPLPDQTDVSRAWEIVNEVKRAEFEEARAKCYLGKSNDEAISKSKAFYEVAITYAAQVGLVLTWGTLRRKNPAADVKHLLDATISGINAALQTGPTASRDRRLILSKSDKGGAFNQLPRLDAPYASFFRFFWLELLLIESNHPVLQEAGVNIDEALELLSDARRFYLNFLVDEVEANLEKANRTQDRDEIREEAKTLAVKNLAAGYVKWFGHEAGQARDLLRGLLSSEARGASAATSLDAAVGEVPEDVEADEGT